MTSKKPNNPIKNRIVKHLLSFEILKEQLRAELENAKRLNSRKTNKLYEPFRVTDETIEEPLDLSNYVLPFSIVFENCKFEDHISLSYSKLKSFHLLDCECKSIDAIGIEVEDDFCIASTEEGEKKSVVFGTLRLTNANIGKRLVLNGTSIYEGDKKDFKNFSNHIEISPRGALDAGNITIGSTVWLKSVSREDENGPIPFESYGAVIFRNSKIKGRVYCNNGVFRAGRHSSHVDLDKLKDIKLGSVPFCPSKYILYSEFGDELTKLEPKALTELKNEEAENNPYFREKYLQSYVSIDFYNAKIDGSIIKEKCDFVGIVRLGAATIGGKLALRGCSFSEIQSYVPKEISKDDKDRIIYQNTLIILNHYASSLHLPRGALDAYHIKVKGSVYFTGSKRAFADQNSDINSVSVGRVSFSRADVGGKFNLQGSRMLKSCDFFIKRNKPMAAFELTGGRIGSNLHLGDGLEIYGSTLMSGLAVEGRMYITNARLYALQDDSDCFHAKNVSISSKLIIESSSQFFGDFVFKNSNFGSHVEILDSYFLPKSEDSQSRFSKMCISNIFEPKIGESDGEANETVRIENIHDLERKTIVDFSSSRIDGSFRLSHSIFKENTRKNETKKDEAFSTKNPRKVRVIGRNNELLCSDLKESCDNTPYNNHSIILGGISLECSTIASELDLCALSVNFDQNLNGSELSSILHVDVRHSECNTLRVNKDLPRIGFFLANGFKFHSIAGHLLNNYEVAKELIIKSSIVEDSINHYYFHNISNDEVLRIVQEGKSGLGEACHFSARIQSSVANCLIEACENQTTEQYRENILNLVNVYTKKDLLIKRIPFKIDYVLYLVLTSSAVGVLAVFKKFYSSVSYYDYFGSVISGVALIIVFYVIFNYYRRRNDLLDDFQKYASPDNLHQRKRPFTLSTIFKRHHSVETFGGSLVALQFQSIKNKQNPTQRLLSFFTNREKSPKNLLLTCFAFSLFIGSVLAPLSWRDGIVIEDKKIVQYDISNCDFGEPDKALAYVYSVTSSLFTTIPIVRIQDYGFNDYMGMFRLHLKMSESKTPYVEIDHYLFAAIMLMIFFNRLAGWITLILLGTWIRRRLKHQ